MTILAHLTKPDLLILIDALTQYTKAPVKPEPENDLVKHAESLLALVQASVAGAT